VLDLVLGKLARQYHPDVLVGFETADDAGVFRLTDEIALVQTVDFFTPVVDDPFTYGEIAAVNSLNDVYAMGGHPVSSLAMVCYPEKGDLDVLERILAGGLSKMKEAGCVVIGGHSVRDPEIKFGYAVTGRVHPERFWRNSTAQAGDALVFTKAIGTGVISTAVKRGEAREEWSDAATAAMRRLNHATVEVIHDGGFVVHAATDVTGFGLIGHAREMAMGSNLTLRIEAGRVPLLPGALECVEKGFVPGGLHANRDFAECTVMYRSEVESSLKTLLFDPQTAGGLLLAVPSAGASKLVETLRFAGIQATRIGEVVPRGEKPIEVL
jgi:selenide,water dikinase